MCRRSDARNVLCSKNSGALGENFAEVAIAAMLGQRGDSPCGRVPIRPRSAGLPLHGRTSGSGRRGCARRAFRPSRGSLGRPGGLRRRDRSPWPPLEAQPLGEQSRAGLFERAHPVFDRASGLGFSSPVNGNHPVVDRRPGAGGRARRTRTLFDHRCRTPNPPVWPRAPTNSGASPALTAELSPRGGLSTDRAEPSRSRTGRRLASIVCSSTPPETRALPSTSGSPGWPTSWPRSRTSPDPAAGRSAAGCPSAARAGQREAGRVCRQLQTARRCPAGNRILACPQAWTVRWSTQGGTLAQRVRTLSCLQLWTMHRYWAASWRTVRRSCGPRVAKPGCLHWPTTRPRRKARCPAANWSAAGCQNTSNTA